MQFLNRFTTNYFFNTTQILQIECGYCSYVTISNVVGSGNLLGESEKTKNYLNCIRVQDIIATTESYRQSFTEGTETYILKQLYCKNYQEANNYWADQKTMPTGLRASAVHSSKCYKLICSNITVGKKDTSCLVTTLEA